MHTVQGPALFRITAIVNENGPVSGAGTQKAPKARNFGGLAFG